MPEKRLFQELAGDVRDIFANHDKAEDFIRMLQQAQIKISEFESAFRHMPVAGGAIGRGQSFSNNYALYNALDEAEKGKLKELYRTCVDRLEREFPDLRKDYFVVFDR